VYVLCRLTADELNELIPAIKTSGITWKCERKGEDEEIDWDKVLGISQLVYPK